MSDESNPPTGPPSDLPAAADPPEATDPPRRFLPDGRPIATKRDKKKKAAPAPDGQPGEAAPLAAAEPLVPDLLQVQVPVGGRVMVLSDLHLGQNSTDDSEVVTADIAREVDAWVGPGAVILNGDCFELLAESHLDPGRALAAHPRLAAALLGFSQEKGRRVVVVPGNHDGALAWHPAAVATLAKRLGAVVTLAVDLQIHTGAGVRRVRVEHGHRFDPHNAVEDPRNPGETPLGHYVVRALGNLRRPGAAWLADLELLADTRRAGAFVFSRLFYRRLVRRFGWMVVPFLVVLVSGAISLGAHFAGHPGLAMRARSWMAGWGLWGVAITTIVSGVALLWWLSIRGPLTALGLDELVDGSADGREEDDEQNDPARAFGHRLTRDGFAGFVTGHTHDAELSDLGGGFYANSGTAGTIVVERPGRFGLPSAWVRGRQESWVELEAGAQLHVRLRYGRKQRPSVTMLERLCTRRAVDSDGAEPMVVASWPEGLSYPVHAVSGTERRRARRIGASAIALAGLINVLSAVTPPLRQRLHALESYVPLEVTQAAAVVVVLSGLVLLMVARGVLRGQRRAWLVAIGVLFASFLTHVVKGLDVEEAIVSGAVLLYLLAAREHFRARSDEGSWRRSIAVLLAGAGIAIAGGVAAVEIFPGRHEPRLGLWRAIEAVAQRMVGISTIHVADRLDDFLQPTLLAVTAGLVVYTGWLLFRPVLAHRLAPPAPEAAERARSIVAEYGGDTLAYFALRGDKRWFFHGDTLVAYAVTQGVALVSPDPIGPVSERRRAWLAFRRFADDHGWPVAVMGASEDWLGLYRATGMRELYTGDEAVVDVRRFTLDGGRNKGLRQAVNRIANYGYRMEFHDPATIDPELEASLRALMTESRRGEMERGFSMTLGRIFDPADRGLLLAVCFAPDGTPAAFCQYVPAPGVRGFSLDLMRRSEAGDHPNGLTDYVVAETISYLREQGMVGLGLNFATMRGVLAGERGDGISRRFERWFYRKMSDTMQIESLWKYNEKFDPDWVPRYACYESPEHLLPSAAALAKAESWWEIPVVGRFFQPGSLEGPPPCEEPQPKTASHSSADDGRNTMLRERVSPIDAAGFSE